MPNHSKGRDAVADSLRVEPAEDAAFRVVFHESTDRRPGRLCLPWGQALPLREGEPGRALGPHSSQPGLEEAERSVTHGSDSRLGCETQARRIELVNIEFLDPLTVDQR